MVDDWAAAALKGGQVPTCSGEAGFAVQAVRVAKQTTAFITGPAFSSDVFMYSMVHLPNTFRIAAGDGRRQEISDGRETGGGRGSR